MIKSNIQQIGKNRYAYLTAGTGEVLVLLHGFTGSSETWYPLIEKWASAFQVIAIDLPGHGNTVTPNFPQMMDFCDELRDLLDLLDVQKCHLLGYSMGGRIALSFAQRHPQRLRSLLLESASPGLQSALERKERQQNDEALAKRILQNGVEAFVEEWEQIPLFATQNLLPAATRAKMREERLMQSAAGLSQSLMRMGTGVQPSWWGRLSTLKMPVGLIVGELDEKFIQINKKMECVINSSELFVVGDAGHAVHVEQPGKFATIVLELLYF
jgi:2-succinyl-6-hydroxy-2,4-cyclohexadiene-1-carboxylate synthase